MKNILKTLLLSSAMTLMIACAGDEKPTSKSTQAIIAELIAKAEQGDAESQYDLGFLYYRGRGVKKSDKESFQWFQKAAKQEFAKAQYSLGMMYFLGRGVKADNILAYAWVQLAAKNGSQDAIEDIDILGMALTPEELAKAKTINPLTAK